MLLAAKICYGDQYAMSVDCTLRGLSPAGASLRVQANLPLPSQFILLTIAEATAHDARVVWRRGDFVGVSLGEPIDLKGPVEDRLRAVRRLWVAVAPH